MFQAEFENIINNINSIYAEAESLSPRTYLENCFACLTAYLVLICMQTNYEKNVKRASAKLFDFLRPEEVFYVF